MGEGGGGGGWPRDTGLVLIASPRQRSIVHWRRGEGGGGDRGRRGEAGGGGSLTVLAHPA